MATDYEGGAQGHSLIAVITWVVYGLYLMFLGRFENVTSILLYFIIGLFIASIASMITYIPMYLLDKLHDRYHSSVLGALSLVFTPITILSTIALVIYVAKVFLSYL